MNTLNKENQFLGKSTEDVREALKTEYRNMAAKVKTLDETVRRLYEMPRGVLVEIVANANGRSVYPEITEEDKDFFVATCHQLAV